MALHRFTTNEEWNSGMTCPNPAGSAVLRYSGSLGGGTLSVLTTSRDVDPDTNGVIKVPVPAGKLNATKVDVNGDVIQQMTFASRGTIIVRLTGATNPDVKVMVD